MTSADRWLLPDGIDELLPQQAEAAEALRLKLLDTYRRWGYELVKPPMVEFLESLKVGTGHDLALQTFTLTDQLSGRLLGLRADLTPQVARMDAHSLKREAPTRLCYCAPVLHSSSTELSGARELDQIGIELFGSPSVDADWEVIQLMLQTVEVAGGLSATGKVKLDLGNVEIYRALARSAGLSDDLERELCEILQRKAGVELAEFIEANVKDSEIADLLAVLPSLCGSGSVLEKAQALFSGIKDSNLSQALLAALTQLENISKRMSAAFPDLECYFDLGELRGYDYHTGLVFAVYKEGYAYALAKGGRYDSIGECFGRSRPATGFSSDLRKLVCFTDSNQGVSAILVPAFDDSELAQTVADLRTQGETLVQALGGDEDILKQEVCDRELVKDGASWVVKSL